MTIGSVVDLIGTTAWNLLLNPKISITLFIVTALTSLWMATRNHLDYRRAKTLTVGTFMTILGVTLIEYLDVGISMLDDHARPGTLFILTAMSLIVGYWIAAYITVSKKGFRENALNYVADLLEKYSQSVRSNISQSPRLMSSKNKELMEEVRTALTSPIPKKRGRKKKIDIEIPKID